MKRFLSLLLAILMVVGMLPLFVLSVGAQGATASEFPQLVITELMANCPNIGELYASLKTQMTDEFYSLSLDVFYEPVNVKTGRPTAYYVKNADGTFSRGKGSRLDPKTVYYREKDPSGVGDNFAYIEIYNAGNEPIDLYDYKLAFDANASTTGDTVVYNDMYAGGVQSSFRKEGFQKVKLPYNTCLKGYYAFEDGRYVEYTSLQDRAEIGGTYYRAVENEYFMVNPEQAVLQPGQCAVVWLYSYNDWLLGLTGEQFKAFYEWRMSQSNTSNSFGVDLSDTLFIGVDANQEELSFGYVEDCFNLAIEGVAYYGIVSDDVSATTDTARLTDWTSWVHWSAYAGAVLDSFRVQMPMALKAADAKAGDLIAGESDVMGYYVHDAANDVFVRSSAFIGTANEDGTAKSGVSYYKWADITSWTISYETDASAYYVFDAETNAFVKPSFENETASEEGKTVDDVSYYEFTPVTVTVDSTHVTGYYLYDEASNVYVRPSYEDSTCTAEGVAVASAVYYKLNLDNEFIKPGETDVVDYFTYDAKTKTFTSADVKNGTADESGKAVENVFYYAIDFEPNKEKDYYTYVKNEKSTSFLYGIDVNASVKEGTAYTASPAEASPGLLTSAQLASLPGANSANVAPSLVITEAAPNPAGTSAYEYVEIQNVSDRPVNVFDYSFALRTSAYVQLRNEYFNKIHTIIPGEYGDISAANYLSNNPYGFYPTNGEYASGWIDPGEVAVIWCYSAEAAQKRADFIDFISFYGLPSSDLKIFATDTDSDTAHHSSLANTGHLMYGLVKNSEIGWTGAPYVSAPVLNPIVYANGSVSNARGVSLQQCESFVLADPVAVSCHSTGLPESYAYQFVWNNGSRLGALLDRGTMIDYVNQRSVKFSNPCLNDAWINSPGTLSAEQIEKTEKAADEGRYVLYMQEIDNIGTTLKYDAAANRLGITDVEGTLGEDHLANVAAADGKLLTSKNGVLSVNNAGTKDDYMVLKTLPAGVTKYTLEYSMTYAADSATAGFSGIIFGFDAATATYAQPVASVLGNVTNTANVGEVVSALGAEATLDGSLVGQKVTVRVEVDAANGVALFVDGVKVSSTDVAQLENWNAFAAQAGTQLVMKTSAGVKVDYDYIMVYTDNAVENAEGFVLMGELADGNALYFDKAIMGQNFEPFMEVTEAKTSAVYGESTKIAFVAEIGKVYCAALEDRFGDVNLGIMAMRAADMEQVDALRPAAFDAAGLGESYWIQDGFDKMLFGSSYQYESALANMKNGYYSDAYTAVTYVQFETLFGTVTYYSERGESYTVKQVLASAMMDFSTERNDEYCYDVGDGTYSRYTAAQRKYFADLCKNMI